MKTWEALTMSQKEAPRIGLLTALVARRVTEREVAAALAVTVWYSLQRWEVSYVSSMEQACEPI